MPRKPRILILNWRDIKNPSSGGAEVLTHEIAKRWSTWGYEVSHFSSYFKGAKKEEIIDGVKIIRRGNPDARHFHRSVHFMAFLYYKKNKNKFDVVIDEIHGLPFFTPLYVKKKKVALICEVANEIWDVNFPFPFNKIGKLIEKNYFRFYKKEPFLTISNSTKNDLIKFGVSKKNITVLPMGITLPKKLPNFKKEKKPTMVFVGRLLKAKGIEDAIEVGKILKQDLPDIRLWVIGRGEEEYEKKLKSKAKESGLQKSVLFQGFVKQDKKFELISRSHVLVVPSTKEGFGLTVPEAGIVGTPAVAYNVGGLRDIIQNGRNGFVVDINPSSMALGIKRILANDSLYKRLQEGATISAKKLDWDNTAKVALSKLVS
ncbi:MAG: glycosyltransferase family 4 protein [Candidatus Levyibacteriota bacterium]